MNLHFFKQLVIRSDEVKLKNIEKNNIGSHVQMYENNKS